MTHSCMEFFAWASNPQFFDRPRTSPGGAWVRTTSSPRTPRFCHGCEAHVRGERHPLGVSFLEAAIFRAGFKRKLGSCRRGVFPFPGCWVPGDRFCGQGPSFFWSCSGEVRDFGLEILPRLAFAPKRRWYHNEESFSRKIPRGAFGGSCIPQTTWSSSCVPQHNKYFPPLTSSW